MHAQNISKTATPVVLNQLLQNYNMLNYLLTRHARNKNLIKN